MTRILVDPDQLRSLSAQFERVSQDLREVASRANSAWNNLDIRVRQRAAIGGQVSEAFSRGHALAREAMVRANDLLTKAQAFEEADRQGVTGLQNVIDKYPIPVITPVPEPVPLPSLVEIFDVLKASLSTITLFVTSLGLEAVKVFTGAVDFFIVKVPKAEKAFQRWEEYNRRPLTDWDRETAQQYEEEARKALEDLGIGALKDTLDLIADKLPAKENIDQVLKKIYDAIGAVQEWIEALGGESQ